MALGDGPAGPEAIAGAILDRPASSPSAAEARPPAPSERRFSWPGPEQHFRPCPLAGLAPCTQPRPRAGPRPAAMRWWLPFYLLLCGPFLVLSRVRWPGGAVVRTLLVVAVVIGVLVTAALLVERQQRSGTEAPAQVQPAATGPGSGAGDGG